MLTHADVKHLLTICPQCHARGVDKVVRIKGITVRSRCPACGGRGADVAKSVYAIHAAGYSYSQIAELFQLSWREVKRIARAEHQRLTGQSR